MKNALMINFEKNQIVMTRQFAKKCTDTRSPEYHNWPCDSLNIL